MNNFVKIFLFLTFLLVAAHGSTFQNSKNSRGIITPKADPICDDIASVLPSYCNLTLCQPNVTINTLCDVDLLSLLNLTVEADLHLCADPVNINFTFAIPEDGFSYSTVVSDSITFGIPGLSINFGVGEAGIYVTVSLETSSDTVIVEVGIEACVGLLIYDICEPNPPLDVFDMKINVNGLCEDAKGAPIKIKSLPKTKVSIN